MELGGAAEQGNNRPGAEQGEHNNTGPQRRGFGEEQKLPSRVARLLRHIVSHYCSATPQPQPYISLMKKRRSRKNFITRNNTTID
jgi:hypothetical protein